MSAWSRLELCAYLTLFWLALCLAGSTGDPAAVCPG
jgi:hypothetical protein